MFDFRMKVTLFSNELWYSLFARVAKIFLGIIAFIISSPNNKLLNQNIPCDKFNYLSK